MSYCLPPLSFSSKKDSSPSGHITLVRWLSYLQLTVFGNISLFFFFLLLLVYININIEQIKEKNQSYLCMYADICNLGGI